MAKIVLGVGSAHTPQLHTAAEQWEIRADRDRTNGVPLFYKGERIMYDDLLKLRGDNGYEKEMVMDVRQRKLEQCYERLDQLAEIFAAAKPDVAIIFGNDQHELFKNDLRPAITVMAAEKFENMPRTDVQKTRLPPGIEISDHGHLPDDLKVYPGHPELGMQLIKGLMAREFDVAVSMEQYHPKEEVSELGGMPHAYGFIYKQIFKDNIVPHVPVDINTFCPPNQPSVARCIKLGKAVAETIEAWDSDARVAIICTGGLSHFVIEPEFDMDIVDAMIKRDWDRLTAYHDGHFQAGNSEIKSWIACASAMGHANLTGEMIDYQALYRTEAGTGSSCCFMKWD